MVCGTFSLKILVPSLLLSNCLTVSRETFVYNCLLDAAMEVDISSRLWRKKWDRDRNTGVTFANAQWLRMIYLWIFLNRHIIGKKKHLPHVRSCNEHKIFCVEMVHMWCSVVSYLLIKWRMAHFFFGCLHNFHATWKNNFQTSAFIKEKKITCAVIWYICHSLQLENVIKLILADLIWYLIYDWYHQSWLVINCKSIICA